MTTTPRLGITELTAGQAVPETTVNEMVRKLEGFSNAAHFKSRATNPAQPGSPADGDMYLLTGTPTGTNWSGQGGKIALYISTAWVFFTAKEGYFGWVDDENLIIAYDGAAWNTFTSATASAAADVWAGTSTSKFNTPKAVQDAAVPTALTSGATITPDFNAGLNFTLTLAHNATLANPSNVGVGDSGVIEITQDGTGSRTMAYGTNWKFPGGAPVLSTAIGAIDVLVYYVVASGRILANVTKAYSS